VARRIERTRADVVESVRAAPGPIDRVADSRSSRGDTSGEPLVDSTCVINSTTWEYWLPAIGSILGGVSQGRNLVRSSQFTPVSTSTPLRPAAHAMSTDSHIRIGNIAAQNAASPIIRMGRDARGVEIRTAGMAMNVNTGASSKNDSMCHISAWHRESRCEARIPEIWGCTQPMLAAVREVRLATFRSTHCR
jgi:hypothetical protein